MYKLFLHELRKRRNGIIGWGIGLIVYVAYIILLYPAIGEEYAKLNMDNPMFQMLLGDVLSMATFSGFFILYVANYFPVMAAVYPIVNGTGTLAGEEEAGTLELLLSLPLYRWQLVLAKALALATALLLITLLMAAGSVVTYLAMESLVDSNMTVGEMVLIIISGWPVLLFLGMLSLFLGALLPSRRMASMMVTLVLVAGFFVNNLANMSEPMEKIQWLSPLYYYKGSEILSSGLQAGDWAVLVGTSLLFVLLAILSFARRDVTVGTWSWGRARVA